MQKQISKPGGFDGFIVASTLIIFAHLILQPHNISATLGIIFVAIGFVCLAHEVIPWGCVPK